MTCLNTEIQSSWLAQNPLLPPAPQPLPHRPTVLLCQPELHSLAHSEHHHHQDVNVTMQPLGYAGSARCPLWSHRATDSAPRRQPPRSPGSSWRCRPEGSDRCGLVMCVLSPGLQEPALSGILPAFHHTEPSLSTPCPVGPVGCFSSVSLSRSRPVHSSLGMVLLDKERGYSLHTFHSVPNNTVAKPADEQRHILYNHHMGVRCRQQHCPVDPSGAVETL